MLEIKSLPAREGDAIWIRWGSAASPHQLVIDMGTEGSGEKLRERFAALPKVQRKLDLLVITHIDRDHIGGVLTCLAEADPLPGFEVTDVWFNGYVHLSGGAVASGLEPMGPAQGERLSKWLKTQRWNKAFNGKPVQRVPGQPLSTVTLESNLKLTVLGPTPKRLSNLIDTWKDEVKIALAKGTLDLADVAPGLESMGSGIAPILDSADALRKLAENREGEEDDTKANGSSITLLLEYEGRKLILAGDGHSPDLVEAIQATSPGARPHIDLFKLPHHGSLKNVHRGLIEAVDCDRWLISTDGTRFKHPDPEAVARIIQFSTTPKPLISFNVPSKFNGWWKKAAWQDRFKYSTEYGTTEDGWSHTFG